MKKIIIAVIFCLISFTAVAKKNADISLAGQEKFQPKNRQILKRVWSRGLKSGSPSKRYYPETSGPVLVDGVIYVGTHGEHFYAVDAASGKILWDYKHDEPISSTAAVFGDRVTFTDLGGRVVCLNRGQGTPIWQMDLGREMLGRLATDGHRLFVLKGEQEVVALSADDGHVVWDQFIRTYVKDITMRGHAGIVSDGGALYVGLADGHLYKLSAAGGQILWDRNLSLPLRAFKDIDAQVLIEGDSLYVGGYFGAVYRLNKDSGSVVWTSEVATGTPPLILPATVVVSDTDGNLVALDKKTGDQLWYNDIGSVLSSPAPFDDKIFVSSFKNDAYVFEAQNGQQVQRISVGDGSINMPVVDGNRIIVLTNGAGLVSLNAK